MQVNPEMVSRLEDAGLSFTGKDETGQRMEVESFGLADFRFCIFQISLGSIVIYSYSKLICLIDVTDSWAA